MKPYLQTLSDRATRYVSCYPNAGMPDGMGGFDSTADEFAGVVHDLAKSGLINVVGGCCGTTPDYIRAVSKAVEGIKPRKVPQGNGWSTYSGFDFLELRPESNFLNVGERTNVTGSRRFARLIREEKYDEAIEVARAQVEGGAQVVDVNMDEGLLDGPRCMEKYLWLLHDENIRVPIMIDSSRLERHRGRAEVRSWEGHRQQYQPEGRRSRISGQGSHDSSLRSSRDCHGIR
ncbi:MAG: dihydropteroate synthase [Planctomycetaceae bacterium]